MEEVVISVKDIRKHFIDNRLGEVRAVDGLSFECFKGEILGILGPNGAGKTTLLRMLATILMPTSGTATVFGYDICEQPNEVKRCIGFLSGNTKLYKRLSAIEITRFFGRLYGMDEGVIRDKSEAIFDLLGMHKIKHRRFDKLSTGEKQKVSIARSLIHEPPLLILDEPTAGLDVVSAKSIIEFIHSSRENHKTIIISTHYMTEAEEVCDRVALINHGKIKAVGTIEELLERSGKKNLNEAFFHYLDDNEATAE